MLPTTMAEARRMDGAGLIGDRDPRPGRHDTTVNYGHYGAGVPEWRKSAVFREKSENLR